MSAAVPGAATRPSAPTLAEAILWARSRGPVVPGSRYHAIEVDLFLGHDATFTLGIDAIERQGLPLPPAGRLLLAADHFAPPSSPERAAVLRTYLDFLERRGLPRDRLFRGISHQLAAEDRRCVPGAVVAGADSHTTTLGALGCFATGFGTTDSLAILATGTAFLPIPPSVRVELRGSPPPWIEGKDVALALLARLGEDGALEHVLELHDGSEPGLPMGARLSVSNHAVEGGATAALFVPDALTLAHLEARDGRAPAAADLPRPAPGARYARTLTLDLHELEPLVARPGSPADVAPIGAVAGTRIHQAFLGSCAAGRLDEIERAAAVLRGRRVHDGVRLVVTPASEQVWMAAAASGALGALTAAGAQVTNASCGACGGIDKGILGPDDVCISTSNRNYRGRMGHPEARIYLAGAAAVAAAALEGRICDPRPYLAAADASRAGEGEPST